MTSRVLDWLPLGMAAREPVHAKITAAVSAWSDAWFAPPRRLQATRLAPARSGETSGQGGGWRIPRRALAVNCPQRMAARLLDWALDADVQRLSATDTDRRLVDAFEMQLFEDLAARIEGALGMQPNAKGNPACPYGPLGGLSVEIADAQGDTLISLGLSMGDLLPAFRASLPAPPRPTRKLTGLRTALADTRVCVEAILGTATLGLADLQTLAPGDVLVLETGLDDTASLALAGFDRSFGRAALTHADDALVLTLQA